MQINRLLNTTTGRFFISVLLGLGLASLFRKVCKDKNCITFNGPIISETEGKIFKHGEGCYKYEMEPVACDKTKQTVDISEPPKENESSMPTAVKAPEPVESKSTMSMFFGKWA